MNRDDLVGLLDKLFGSQAEASRQLNTSRRTIAAWGKENPVPNAVAALLRMLDDERKHRKV
ncbi:helix-turn-helix domain-containing protein [Limnoglobus roseus]|uniref:hypothetical protein n=1 Tax=Limnoglobus roseus TaxID=2598579 RepID=UPI0011EB7804|nr:hypothetical protein [Limnoglobus roseus]